MTAAVALEAPPKPAPSPAPVWNLRIATGLGGVLLAAMMSGLNDRVGGLALADIAGARGLATDDAHLLSTIYEGAQLAAMPVASWLAGTFSLRRFHLAITGVFLLCAVLLPLAPDLGWMMGLRAVQGLAGGAMIPLLMSAALRFLPPAIKLQGLGFYSLTATFSPNLALWLAATWIDGLGDWRLAYWQVIPAALAVLWAIWWGLPQDPLRLERLREMDLPALLAGPSGLMLLAFALEEGERLDWFHSPLIAGSFTAGLALIALFLVSEWFHPAPFVKLQLMGRRNYGLGMPVFLAMLVVIIAAALLPAVQLGEAQGFRPQQIAPIGLIIALPQLALAPLVSWLLYRRWVDARQVMALGLLLIGLSCWIASGVTGDWMVRQFWLAQALQTLGQPLSVVAFLYLAVGVIGPAEAPYVSGLINTLKTLASVIGAVLVERLLLVSASAHLRGFADRAGMLGDHAPGLFEQVHAQSATLAVADAYRAAALLALLLIPPTLCLTYVAPPAPPSKD
ncbi:MFS transporter [Novosphingobium terrae]|uniref:MFS transporter n=1 Tax=Novosphingobium terrae TaxID=2726189 RepID=UPI001981DD1A|nr:MFS transporter [Novosphingobium terrae]